MTEILPSRTEGIAAAKPSAPAKRGCLFYGCLTALIVGLAGTVFLIFGGIWAAKKLQSAAISGLTPYTETAPAAFPRLAATEGDYDKLRDRLQKFREDLKSSRPAQINFTTNDLEALLAFDPELKNLSSYGRVRVEDNEVVGEVSIPMEKVPFLTIPGRYMNGTASFSIASLPDGIIFVGIRDIKVRGQSLPEEFMRGIRAENLAKKLYESDDESLRKIKNIEVKGGVITVEASP